MSSAFSLNFLSYFAFWLLLSSPVYSSSNLFDVRNMTETGSSTVQRSTSDCVPEETKDPITPTILTVTGTSLTKPVMSTSTSKITESSIIVASSSLSSLPPQSEIVLPGGSAVTVGGTPVSLGFSGILVIGTSTIILPSKSSAVEVFTIGSQPVTIDSTGFEVILPSQTLPLLSASIEITIVPGGDPVTVGTVPVSMGQGGTLVIGGSAQVISATQTETITVNGETIIVSSSGFVAELPTVTTAGLTTAVTGTMSSVFSTTFISIPSLSTWSQITTELPGQTTQTVLPIWPCSILCPSGYNGVIVIPQSPLPTSNAVIPPPFTFPPLTIGSNGLPATVATTALPASETTATAAATTINGSISSTMTTVPPGFSTEATTNTLWTANTWLTTTNGGGSPTIVPVLVGCPGCGGLHGGIILWNLPEIPRVSFQFPELPGLPKFHLPCIKIFGIRITGDCDNPPSTDGENPNNPTNTEKRTYSSTAPSTTSVSDASSSSSCSSTVVPSCTQLCGVVTQSGGSVSSSCASAVCQTITACSTAPTTITSYTTTSTSEWVCAPTCSACAGDSRNVVSGASSSSTPSTLAKRVFPQPDHPEDKNDRFKWFVEKVNQIAKLADDMVEIGEGTWEGLSSSQLNPLSSIDGIAGITGAEDGIDDLHGCAVVVVATPEAIWMGHMWQTSFFKEELFQTDVLDFMTAGHGNWPGLQIFIDDPETHPLSPMKQPVVLIIGARDRDNLAINAPKYPDMFVRMRDALQLKFPYSPIKQFNYTTATRSGQLAGVYGKVLVQYDPAQPDCNGVLRPTIRIWVQGEVVEEAPFHNYPSQKQDSHRKRDTSNTACPLSWGQSITPYEITATYSTSATYTSSATSLASTTLHQTTTVATSVTSLSTASNSPFCFPSTSLLSAPTGLPQNQIAKNITDICAAIDTYSKGLKGCDSQFHNGILLSVDCNGAGNASGGPSTINGLRYDYPGIHVWLNISLVQGKSFIVNSSTCNSAFSTVLNDCPPLANDTTQLSLNKTGGSLFISDGAGAGVNFNISLVPAKVPGQNGVPGCAYVVANDLKSKALCSVDYCNCGGTAAPLLTSTILGSTTLDCGYSTLPTIATCPPSPTSTASTLPSVQPTGTTCNCNEDGCTSDSPPCCASGTCPGQPVEPARRRRETAGPTLCDCDENSCTPESPPCCANGSCEV